ncbi:Alpha-1,3-mannosyltransferase MNN1 [Wickerhamomyces ciferrii]|uniref:Alpha-1,3-mannosyltransferase MNN1 n=1 Tax=Wickerhamomyces ciferrii (strain ATCC 14091 / BCRC 22168 / CBS 111 / JCM 3599 / NBRC 0793 / NRRL Y-1031 F-60-10) TaxID=1206466 RepID=K0KJS3_WICCF|nr:Alpha-1,3-mannosyltransferase MNN1 [Wickerhamomyces ciferrii]CCH42392.1 Alpha-1,3-mannosyltransferase MNN1 [Wickerhamomyces ciferrii]
MSDSSFMDKVFQYTANVGIYRIQVFKTTVIVTLLFIFAFQIFHGTSGLEQNRELLVIKPDEAYNTHYDSILGVEGFEKMELSERCVKLFNNVNGNSDFKDFEWFYKNLNDIKITPSLKSFIAQKKAEVKQKGERVKDDMIREWEKTYQKDFATDKLYIQKLINYMSTQRVFGTCFIENNLFQEATGIKAYNIFWDDEVDSELSKSNIFQLSNELEIRLFPWISKIYPVYKHGTEQLPVGVPSVGDAHDDEDYNPKSSFLYNFKHGLNGQGIVLPVFDSKDIEHVKRLGKVLRFIGNELPVQIVHKGDLKDTDEAEILEIYSEEIDSSKYFQDDSFDQLPPFYTKSLPKQDVYFANIEMSVNAKFHKSWDRTRYKNFALLFSSFQRVLMLDPAVLPLNGLLSILQNVDFTKTGTYYFPDFRLNAPVDKNELEFFTDLLPTKVDEHLFPISQVSKEFLENSRFFKDGFTSIANNDVIVLDKKEQFLGILTSLTLSHLPLTFKTKNIQKEFIWLGPLLSGYSPEVHFHSSNMGIVGEYTEEENRRIKDSVSKEICSMHKGHFDSDNSTLLFVTNGALNCDRDGLNLEEEIKKPAYRKFKGQVKDLIKWNLEATKLKAAIIPIQQEITAKNKVDEVDTSITDKEGYCNSEILCAYDILGAKNDKKFHGDVVEFTASQYQVLEYIDSLWTLPSKK